MEKQFLNHIATHRLFTADNKILLAVSGGIDSMVMLHLFHKASFNIGIAHCNFQLRGEDSDRDEALVRTEASSCGVLLHCRRFDTETYAREQSLSIQMAARTLRYDWFRELAAGNQYDYIATAHHLNDSLETVLLNLVRGTGVEGMAGIPLKHEKIVRPLLFATRSMIDEYAAANSIQWRDDASNADDEYQRNFIRLKVVPLLREINPGFENRFSTTLERFRGGWYFAQLALEQFSREAVRYDGGRMLLKKKALKERSYAAVLLWELLKSRDFHFDQCVDIASFHHQAGKWFYSSSHRLLIDREFIIIDRYEEAQPFHVEINHGAEEAQAGGSSLFFQLVAPETFAVQKDANKAQLDAGLLKFPLIWRSWMPGDHFIPLGMKKRKKISDFLVDEKVPLNRKDSVTVIESGNEIVWVVGMRIADPFKVTEKTRQVLVITKDESAIDMR